MRVIIHFKGGLGNQLIQYAFVQKFLMKQGTELVMDDSHFKFYGERVFFLKDFPQKKVSVWLRMRLLAGMYFKILVNKLHSAGILPYWKSVLGNYIDDDVKLEELQNKRYGNLYVNGYFQHFEIFPLPQGNLLHTYMDELSEKMAGHEDFEQIKMAVNPIMLHVRRGDYVTNETVKKNMGVCSLDYFKRGIDLLSGGKEGNPLFVFSDDIEYAAQMFKSLDQVYIIKGNTSNPIQDFLLMRQFKHAVISNSTLSYMASMLSVHDDNIVVFPEPWFENGQKFLLGMKKNWKNVSKR